MATTVTEQGRTRADTPRRIHYRGVQENSAMGYAKSANGSMTVSPACAEVWDSYCKQARREGPVYEPELRAFAFAFDAVIGSAQLAETASAHATTRDAGHAAGLETARAIVENRIAAPLGLAVPPGTRGLPDTCDAIAQAVRDSIAALNESVRSAHANATAALTAHAGDPIVGLPERLRSALEALILEVGILSEERDASAAAADKLARFKELLKD